MSTSSQTKWRIVGEEASSCNCAWGCPCQFIAVPTYGRCESFAGSVILEGYFGTTQLNGVLFAHFYWWPGPLFDGNGTRQLIIDEKATQDQRAALIALESGTHGGTYYEILAALCPNQPDPLIAPITFESDRDKRRAYVYIPELAELRTEPIINPVTGEEHRARIVLPNGFHFKEAEVGNTIAMHVNSTKPLVFENKGTYAQFNTFEWSNS